MVASARASRHASRRRRPTDQRMAEVRKYRRPVSFAPRTSRRTGRRLRKSRPSSRARANARSQLQCRSMLSTLVVTPIGFVHTPFDERASAPRQPYASDAAGTIELLPLDGIEHALAHLDTWDHIWVLFWFHLNESW